MIDEGAELGPVISRRRLTVMAVRRSHFDDVAERERVCDKAVFIKNGVLGRSSFSSAEGDESMMSPVLRGSHFNNWNSANRFQKAGLLL